MVWSWSVASLDVVFANDWSDGPRMTELSRTAKLADGIRVRAVFTLSDRECRVVEDRSEM